MIVKESCRWELATRGNLDGAEGGISYSLLCAGQSAGLESIPAPSSAGAQDVRRPFLKGFLESHIY